MRVISGAVLVPCLLLLLHLAPRTHGLAPQPRGEGAYVRWGALDDWPLTNSLGLGTEMGREQMGSKMRRGRGGRVAGPGADRDGDAPEGQGWSDPPPVLSGATSGLLPGALRLSWGFSGPG